MQYRGYTYALAPTINQLDQFVHFSGVCRLVWNLCLEQRVSHWRQYQRSTGDNLNYVTQARQLKDLRAAFDFVADVSQTAQQRAMKSLDTAFQRFFSGQGGFPKFKRKGAGDSFSFNGREVCIEKINSRWSRIRLPKIGWVKFRDSRERNGVVREVSISRTAIGWQVSIGCMSEESKSDNGLTVGIDRGVTVPLMLSDGTQYGSDMLSAVKKLDLLHKRAQRKESRGRRGSKRHRKAMLRVVKIKARQARIRKHWAHVTTTEISGRYSGVVVERLRTSSMTKSARGTVSEPGSNLSQKRGLNRAILNVGWHQIETMLSYKVARLIRINPSYTSQTCALCGAVDSRSRKSQASFVCTGCGHRDNADRNAAINILNRGSTAVLDVEEGLKAPREASTSQSG